MTKFDFKGAGVALVTPFRENSEVDFDALGVLVENQIAGGMDFWVWEQPPKLRYFAKKKKRKSLLS